MLPTSQILNYLLLIAAGQGLALTVLLWLQGPRSQASGMLCLLFLLLSLGCGERAIEGIFYPPQGDELPFPLAMPLAYLPAIFLHLRLVTRPGEQLRLREALHFLPSLLMDLVAFFLFDWEGKSLDFAIIDAPGLLNVYTTVYNLCFIAQFVIYLSLLQRLRTALLDSQRDCDKVRPWQDHWMVILSAFWLSWIFVRIFGKGHPPGQAAALIVHVSAIAMIYWLGFKYLLKAKASRSERRILPQESESLLILQRIKAAELYRLPRVTLADTSRKIGYPQKSVSAAIIAQGNANFNDCINRLRVEAFQELVALPAYRNLSLFGIAQEVGFSSKASFHRAFKKHCELTPKEFVTNRKTGLLA